MFRSIFFSHARLKTVTAAWNSMCVFFVLENWFECTFILGLFAIPTLTIYWIWKSVVKKVVECTKFERSGYNISIFFWLTLSYIFTCVWQMRYGNKMIRDCDGDERPEIERGWLCEQCHAFLFLFRSISHRQNRMILHEQRTTFTQTHTPLSILFSRFLRHTTEKKETSNGKTIFGVGLTVKWQSEWKSITNQKFSFPHVLR